MTNMHEILVIIHIMPLNLCNACINYGISFSGIMGVWGFEERESPTQGIKPCSMYFNNSSNEAISELCTHSQNATCICCALQIHTVTLIPGDGIGPEISTAVMKIFEAAEVCTCQRKTNRHTKNPIIVFYVKCYL